METTTGMSAPPMGMMISTPIANASSVRSQNAVCDSVRQNHNRQHHDEHPERGVQHVLAGEDDGTAGDEPLQLGERHHRTGEGDGADGRTDGHLDEARDPDVCPPCRCRTRPACSAPRPPPAPRPCRPGLWKGGDELRHRGHRDAARDEPRRRPRRRRPRARSGPTSVLPRCRRARAW